MIDNPKRQSKKPPGNELRYVPTDRETPEEDNLTILLDGVPRIIKELTQEEVERALKQKDERERNRTREAAFVVIRKFKVRNLKWAQVESAKDRASNAEQNRVAWRRRAFEYWHAQAAANEKLSPTKEVAANIHRERKALGVSKDDRRAIGTIKNAIKGVKQITKARASMPIESALENFIRSDSPRPSKKFGR